jgi:uncharacterized membrane protein HdeD (DUF308 family)
VCLPVPASRAEQQQRGTTKAAPARKERDMIVLGVVLLLIGFLAKIAIIWTLGIVAIVVGAVLAIAGTAGHAIGGRRHYW